jgi:hypothetical protein
VKVNIGILGIPVASVISFVKNRGKKPQAISPQPSLDEELQWNRCCVCGRYVAYDKAIPDEVNVDGDTRKWICPECDQKEKGSS